MSSFYRRKNIDKARNILINLIKLHNKGVIIMKIINVQIALFAQSALNRPDQLGMKLNQSLNNLFDTMPTIVNLPADTPAEIPVVQMRSSTQWYSLNISRSRVDFIITPSEENQPIEIFENRYGEIISKVLSALYSDESFSRIGIVITGFEKVKSPLQRISEIYFGGTIKEPSELSFRRNKILTHKNVKMNSILCVTDGVETNNNSHETSKIIIYTRDINSSSEHKTISAKQSENIIKYAYGFLNADIFKEGNR